MSDSQLPGEFQYEGMKLLKERRSTTLIEGAKNLKLNSDDTVVASYPKSGTTWMRVLTHLVANDGMEENASIHLTVPFLEVRDPDFSDQELLKYLTEMPAPRLFSTHLPFRVLKRHVTESNAKFVVVMRNPKDVLVSSYHHYQRHRAYGFCGTWNDFYELFAKNKLYGGDVFDYCLEWWKVSERSNVLVVKYEDMKKSLDAVVRKVAKFMSRDLSEEVIAKIVQLASFEQMKENPNVNGIRGAEMGLYDFSKSKFIRKGIIGDWTNYFSAEQTKHVDRLYEERGKPAGLVFNDIERVRNKRTSQ